MSVEIREVSGAEDVKSFVNLPFELYKDNKFWVPPIKKDEKKAVEDTSSTQDFCDSRFFLALKDGKCVGRCAAIINKSYNEKTGKKYGRINRIEFVDDPEVSEALINTCTAWFKKQGMELIHGPLGFTSLDTQGLLIEGFDQLPSIASVYHLPYYKDHFDRLGFEKENDWVEFRLDLSKSERAVKKGARGADLIKQRFGFEVVNFKSRDEMKKYSRVIFDILNDAFSELPYVNELNEKMIDFYIAKYFDFLNPKFVKVVKKDDELVGFFVGLPSLSEAMQKAKGKLFPTGFAHITKALKKPQVIDMLLTGVKHEHQASGVAVILIAELQNEMVKDGIDYMETTGVFETNSNVIANWKNYEHIQHKRRRCYVKSI